jgi:type I restriction enzyme R subunit
MSSRIVTPFDHPFNEPCVIGATRSRRNRASLRRRAIGPPLYRNCGCLRTRVHDVETVSEIVDLVGEQVTVAIHRDVDARVTKMVLDRLGMNALTDQQARARVPQIVDPRGARKPGAIERRPPDALSEVGDAQRAAARRGEDERAGFGPHGLKVRAKLFNQEDWDPRPANSVGLRFAEYHSPIHIGERLRHDQSATPKRDDNVDSYKYFGEPLFTYSLAQGIEDGFLAPYRVRRVVLSPDAYGYSPDDGQLDLYGREIPPGLYETRDFERVVSLLSRTETAAHHLTQYMKRTDRMAKTVVFCVDQEHADQMRAAIQRENQDLVTQYPNYVARIVSDEGTVGDELLGYFADPEATEPVIVTTSRLLSTGVDLPAVKNVVLFKPIGSMIDFKQVIGRGTRIYEDVNKLSFEIIDYSGATRLFEDPEFDGPPELVILEQVDDAGEVEEEVVTEQSYVLDDPIALTEEEVAERARRKLYVGDYPVYLVAEGYRVLDPVTGRLKLIEYVDYVKDQIRSLFGGRGELLDLWRSNEGREEIRELLASRGVFLQEVAEQANLEDLDALDVLAHLAWNSPATSRRDRARLVRADHGDFFEAFQPPARDVLELLLEKYAEFGVTQLEDLEVLQVSPLKELGTPVEIAARFGGAKALRQAVERLEQLVYAA